MPVVPGGMTLNCGQHKKEIHQMNTCTHCGQSFQPKFKAAKLCFSCWRKREYAFEHFDSMASMLDHLQDRLEMERQQRPGTQQAEPPIPAEKVRQLLSLCHPDRHHETPREQTANEVTKWLNRLKRTG